MRPGQTVAGTDAIEPSVRTQLDLVVVLGLVVLASLLRLDLPGDGLFYDDAWQALGVIEGSLRDLPLIGQTQPGFTLELLGWTALAGTGDAALVTPALVAGVIGPALLYVLLKRWGFGRVIAFLLATLLAVAPVHIAYSLRVKSYTTDVLVMMLLSAIIPRVSRVRWRAPTGFAWVVATLLAATYSSFALLGVVAAGIIIVAHPIGDRRVRLAAVGAQLTAQACLVAAMSQQANTRLITGFFRSRDGFIQVEANPLATALDVLEHLTRVVTVFPGLAGPRWLLYALVVAAAGGLMTAAWRGPLTIQARFLGLAVLMAMAGSALRLVPFGAETGRVTLWMIPALALGLATAADQVQRGLTHLPTLRKGVTAVALSCLAVVVATRADDSHPYPPGGARDGTEFVMGRLDERDAIWLTRPTTFSFALYADIPVRLQPTPQRAIGFLPDFSDDRITPIPDFSADLRALDESLVGTDRVWIVNAEVKRGPGPLQDLRERLAAHLEGQGFRLDDSVREGSTVIDVWQLPE